MTTLTKLLELIKQLIKNKFFGNIEIKFENGKIVSLRKIESIKL